MPNLRTSWRLLNNQNWHGHASFTTHWVPVNIYSFLGYWTPCRWDSLSAMLDSSSLASQLWPRWSKMPNGHPILSGHSGHTYFYCIASLFLLFLIRPVVFVIQNWCPLNMSYLVSLWYAWFHLPHFRWSNSQVWEITTHFKAKCP